MITENTLNVVESATQIICAELTRKGTIKPGYEEVKRDIETLYLNQIPGEAEDECADLVNLWWSIENNWGNCRSGEL